MMTEASRVQAELIRQNNRIIELERDLAAWRGIHEGAVLALQAHINSLHTALMRIAHINNGRDRYAQEIDTVILETMRNTK